MSEEGSSGIDISLTKQHHDYYGEKADPELAKMLAERKNKESSEIYSPNNSTLLSLSVDFTDNITEVMNNEAATRSTITEMSVENVEKW